MSIKNSWPQYARATLITVILTYPSLGQAGPAEEELYTPGPSKDKCNDRGPVEHHECSVELDGLKQDPQEVEEVHIVLRPDQCTFVQHLFKSFLALGSREKARNNPVLAPITEKWGSDAVETALTSDGLNTGLDISKDNMLELHDCTFNTMRSKIIDGHMPNHDEDRLDAGKKPSYFVLGKNKTDFVEFSQLTPDTDPLLCDGNSHKTGCSTESSLNGNSAVHLKKVTTYTTHTWTSGRTSRKIKSITYYERLLTPENIKNIEYVQEDWFNRLYYQDKGYFVAKHTDIDEQIDIPIGNICADVEMTTDQNGQKTIKSLCSNEGAHTSVQPADPDPQPFPQQWTLDKSRTDLNNVILYSFPLYQGRQHQHLDVDGHFFHQETLENWSRVLTAIGALNDIVNDFHPRTDHLRLTPLDLFWGGMPTITHIAELINKDNMYDLNRLTYRIPSDQDRPNRMPTVYDLTDVNWKTMPPAPNDGLWHAALVTSVVGLMGIDRVQPAIAFRKWNLVRKEEKDTLRIKPYRIVNTSVGAAIPQDTPEPLIDHIRLKLGYVLPTALPNHTNQYLKYTYNPERLYVNDPNNPTEHGIPIKVFTIPSIAAFSEGEMQFGTSTATPVLTGMLNLVQKYFHSQRKGLLNRFELKYLAIASSNNDQETCSDPFHNHGNDSPITDKATYCQETGFGIPQLDIMLKLIRSYIEHIKAKKQSLYFADENGQPHMGYFNPNLTKYNIRYQVHDTDIREGSHTVKPGKHFQFVFEIPKPEEAEGEHFSHTAIDTLAIKFVREHPAYQNSGKPINMTVTSRLRKNGLPEAEAITILNKNLPLHRNKGQDQPLQMIQRAWTNGYYMKKLFPSSGSATTHSFVVTVWNEGDKPITIKDPTAEMHLIHLSAKE